MEIKREERQMTDYQDFTTRNTSLEERRKLNVGDIWSNAIKCLGCGDVVRSKNRHDMAYCKCGKSFVDGGSWYGRYGADDLSQIELLTEYFSDVK